MNAEPPLRLGIDGGGSKTRFLLVDDRNRTLASIETGPTNWLSIGPESARRNLAEGIQRLPSPPDVVCGGFAGAGRPEGARFFTDTLQALLPEATILVETDALIAYTGAVGLRPGVLLIAGTGSIAIARTPSGQMNRAGGWGPVFGDEGGGYWIGREAIRAALRAVDREECPEFVEAVRQSLRVESVAAIAPLWSAGTIGVPEVAAVARTVIERYPEEPAKRILDEAAGHLRELVTTVERKLGIEGAPRSIVGSIGATPIVQELIGLPFTQPLHPPELGAILCSRERVP